MATAFPASIMFRDAKNQTSSMRFYLVGAPNTDAELTAIEAAAQAISNAHASSRVNPTGPLVSGSAAVYEDVEDKAEIVFTDANGVLHRYELPAPIAGIFQADGETVDFSNANVGAFAAAMVGHACGRDGVTCSAAVGGFRLRRRAVRKFNVFTRNPALSGQGL